MYMEEIAEDQAEQSCRQGRQVSSAELVRSFAKWRDLSQTAPVYITTHGRVSHVLTGARLYDQIARPEDNESLLSTDDRLTGLSEWVNEGIILCTSDERIIFANQRAKQFFKLPHLNARTTLVEAMPQIEGSVMQVQCRRTIQTGEPITAELPSLLSEGRFMRLKTVPLGERMVIMARDITEEVERYRMADAKSAMLEAIGLHPSVGYIRITARGTIEMTDASFDKWVGISPDKLIGTRLEDLAVRTMRALFRATLDEVLETSASRQIEVELMPNRTGSLRLHCSIVPLAGAYGIEGATIIATRQSD